LYRWIDIEQVLSAPVDKVYGAWTSPAAIERWLSETASGSAEEGGQLALAWPSLGQKIVLDVDRAARDLELRLCADVRGEMWIHELSFEAGEAGTNLRMRHRVPSDQADGIEAGWRLRLLLLETALSRTGARRIITESQARTGPADGVYRALEGGPAIAGFAEPVNRFSPHGVFGHVDDEVVYVLRRFPVAAQTHLLAGQLMTWNDATDLEPHREAIRRAVGVAGTDN